MGKNAFAFLCLAVILVGCVTTQPALSLLTLEQLVAKLEDPEQPDFVLVTRELERRGPMAAPAAPSLVRHGLLAHRCDHRSATFALIAMGPAAAPAIPDLVQALEDERSDVRGDALFILGTIGPSAKCAVPEIAQRLWDAEPGVRELPPEP